MSAWRTWRALSWSERALLAEALLAVTAAALAVALLPFRRVAATARFPRSPRAGSLATQVRAVRWAVGAAARRLPFRAKCLEQAFAAHWLLARRGAPATIHYGIARRGGELVAHAWVRSGELPVVGCENAPEFAEVARFPPGLTGPAESADPLTGPNARSARVGQPERR